MAWGGGSHGSTPFGSQSIAASDLCATLAGTSTLTASIVDGNVILVPGVTHTLKASLVTHALTGGAVSHTLVESKVTHFTS